MTTSTIAGSVALFPEGVGALLSALTKFIPLSYPDCVSLGTMGIATSTLVYLMTFRHAANGRIDRGGDLPPTSNFWLKELNMNILDFLKKLFAVFAGASMVLAYVARPLFMLLAWETDGDDSTEPSHRVCSGFNCNGYNSSGYNRNGFTCSGNRDC